MSRCSRTPTRTALPALRGRRRSSSRAAGAAMPPLAATVAATVPPRGGDGPSTLDDPPRTPAKPQLALDVSPGLLPLRVVHAVALAVAAVLRRRLPELDRLEVRRWGIGVVLRARALGQLVHDRARPGVRRRLAEVDRLLGLHLRRRDPLDPLDRAVRVLRLRGDHPRVGPAGRTLLRDQILHGRLRRLQRVGLVRPRRADRGTAVLEQIDLVAGGDPVLPYQRVLLL